MRKVETYSPDIWPCLERWLAHQETMLVARQLYGQAAATALHLERIKRVLTNPQAQSRIVFRENTPVGMGTLTPLPWDSEQIGMSAARLDNLAAIGDYAQQQETLHVLLDVLLAEAQAQSIRHLSARVEADNIPIHHSLEHAGFELMDGLLTFTLDLTRAVLAEPGNVFSLRLATPDDAECAGRLAHGIYVHDRFHADSAIARERSDALHATWVRNSCAGQAADATILAEEGTNLLGFVTCKLNRDAERHFGASIGSIVLVATSEAARGRGVGKQATLAALHWMRAQGVELVEVGTQLRNITASRLYESCGFRLSGSSLTFRKLLS